MEQSGFQFGRRVEDQLDLLRALVAQGKVGAETARVCFEELAERARRARRGELPRRRWTDQTGYDASRLGRAADPASDGPEAGRAADPTSAAGREIDGAPDPSARPRRSALDRRVHPDRRRRLIEHVAESSLPVRFAGVLDSRHGVGEVPMIVVDGDRRPDVADLPRVFRTEGVQAEARSRWLFVMDDGGRGCALLLVGVTRPVRCRFRLRFSIADDRQLLALVGRAGGFVMTCADPSLDRDRALFEAMYVAVPSEVLSLLGDDPPPL
jgi:hypothetical protein